MGICSLSLISFAGLHPAIYSRGPAFTRAATYNRATLLPPRYSQMRVPRIDGPYHAITYYNRQQLTATIVASSGKATLGWICQF